MTIDKMTLEDKLEYYQRQTHQLKKRRADAIDKIEYLNGYIKELHQEINSLKLNEKQIVDRLNEKNEQLRVIIKEVTELLSDEVDLFSDKATEHDINAYVELKELDNKDAFYMAIAIKKAIKMLNEVQE